MKTLDIKHVLKISSITDNRITSDNFSDLITIAHIDAACIKDQPKESISLEISNTSTFLMILVQKGSAEIGLDHKTYPIASDKLVFIIPNYVLRISKTSNDFNASFLIIDRLFFEETMQERKGSFNYISFKNNPVIRLETDEKSDLHKAFLLLQEKIKLRTHCYYKEMVHNTTTALLLDFLNVLARKESDLIHTLFSRQEDIIDKFFKLLAEHARVQHALTFYADKLFITPKYLSVILKKYTGKTGGKWISEALILEAKKLIKSPRANIQEVAYALNFTNQSAFGKFFKKSVGISPLIYRRS